MHKCFLKITNALKNLIRYIVDNFTFSPDDPGKKDSGKEH